MDGMLFASVIGLEASDCDVTISVSVEADTEQSSEVDDSGSKFHVTNATCGAIFPLRKTFTC